MVSKFSESLTSIGLLNKRNHKGLQ